METEAHPTPLPGLFLFLGFREESLPPAQLQSGRTDVLPSHYLAVAMGPLRGLSSGDKPLGTIGVRGASRGGVKLWKSDSGREIPGLASSPSREELGVPGWA